VYGLSILIPVYKNAPHLEELLNSLTNDPYPHKEIIVVLDEPDEQAAQLPSTYTSAQFIINKERIGKANALNHAVAATVYDYLLFIDSDILITQNNFLEPIVEALNHHELVDIKKQVVRDSLLANLVSYDYLSSSMVNHFFIKYLNRTPQLNGSAFAIQKNVFEELGGFNRVICEDLDLAFRAYTSGIDFGYPPDTDVHNVVDPSLTQWLKQRRRWALGFGEWFNNYLGEFLTSITREPVAFTVALLILFPSSPLIILGWLIPDALILKLLSLALMLLSTFQIYLTPTILVVYLFTFFTRSLISTLSSCFASCVFFYWASRKLKYPFNLLEFSLYYFIYNPIWFLFCLLSIIIVALHRNDFELDWKV